MWDKGLELSKDAAGRVNGLVLPLTPEDWCRACMRDGTHYMGGCCANMGHAQDLLNNIFRDGPWIDLKYLKEYAECMLSHDGYCKKDLPDPIIEAKKGDPIAKIIAVWDMIKDNLAPEKRRKLKPQPVDHTSVKDAMFILSQLLLVDVV